MGTVDLHLRVAGGMIEEARIYGDFFGKLDASEIGERLSGIAYEKGLRRRLWRTLTYLIICSV